MTNLDYAKLMLEIYEDDEPLNIEAINHYREMVVEERGKEITGHLKDLTEGDTHEEKMEFLNFHLSWEPSDDHDRQIQQIVRSMVEEEQKVSEHEQK